MSRHTHTPGPWGTDEEYEHEIVCDSNNCMVADCNIYLPGRSVEENRANARLIAAAPALLEACERLLALVEADRKSLVECNSHIELVDGKCRPVPGTLDPDVAEIVSEYDVAIEAASAAILKTTQPKPKEQGAAK